MYVDAILKGRWCSTVLSVIWRGAKRHDCLERSNFQARGSANICIGMIALTLEIHNYVIKRYARHVYYAYIYVYINNACANMGDVDVGTLVINLVLRAARFGLRGFPPRGISDPHPSGVQKGLS